MKFIIICLFVCLFCSCCFAKELYDNCGENIYQSLSAMEWQIYRKDYSSDDANKRIDRLENSVFGKKSDNQVYERINGLKAALSGSKEKYFNINKQVILDLLENRYFSKTYSQDSIDIRINRLELRRFGSISTGNIEERFKHLTENTPL